MKRAQRILIIPDKFKGTLTAFEAAEAIAKGWRKSRPGDRLTLLPMSDGGDGFGAVLGRLLRTRTCRVDTVDAAHRPLHACWWWAPKTKTAIIESAQIIGLALLPPQKFHPFDLDTYGLGAAFNEAAKKGARRCLIGIGGSATNDGGFGLARALGWHFYDRCGKPIEQWTGLDRLRWVEPPIHRLRFREVLVAVDVQNTLLGKHGASRVYGPQKGLRAADFPMAERCLGRLRAVMRQFLGVDIAQEPGTGAAGGLGFGLRAFMNARLEPGFGLFARFAKLDQQMQKADGVLTGEGSIDASTIMGKGVGEVARLCRARDIPCFGIGGVSQATKPVKKAFTAIFNLAPGLTSVEEAKAKPACWLEQLAVHVAERF